MNLDYVTTNYTMELGPQVENETEVGYNIVNKTTGVIEYSDVLMPRTIEALLNLQEHWDRVDGLWNEGVDVAPVLSIASPDAVH